jgi:hypothetical protein
MPFKILLVSLLLVGSLKVFSERVPRFSFEFLPGGVAALPCSLHIYQQNQPDLHLKARYRTEPFTLPIYYSYRLGYSFSQNQWIELEFNHLKVFLDNPPPEIEYFHISHGYNQFWINYSKQTNELLLRGGLGPVIAHPENNIRGKVLSYQQGLFDMGYYFSGITAQLAAQKRFWIGKHLFFSIEAKVNAAYARVPVVNGYANVPVYTLHGLFGVGGAF